jgi:hypothetical protein
VNGEEPTPPAEQADEQGHEGEGFVAEQRAQRLARSLVIEDPAALPRLGALYATVEGFLRVPLLGRLLVPSVPSDASGSK